MNKLATALELSAMLYVNYKLVKQLYANQFYQIIDPYKREILKECEQQNTYDITTALNSILKGLPDSGTKNEFILYTAAAADIILEKRMPKGRMNFFKPSRN